MTSITLNAAQVEGSEITEEHFGINATADYQEFDYNFVNSVYELMGVETDEHGNIISINDDALNLTTIRYPGGVETERHFDLVNYDNITWVNEDGVTKEFIGLTEFTSFCVDLNIQPVIVIPISELFYLNENGYAKPNEDMEETLKAFVKDTMAMMGDVGVAAFELGNEFPAVPRDPDGDSSNTLSGYEYGDVASWAAPIIQEAIDEYNAENQIDPSVEEPDIIVQLITFSPEATDHWTEEKLAQYNDSILYEFSAEELAAVDGVTAHFYFTEDKFVGDPDHEERAHTYDNIDRAMDQVFEPLDDWETKAGKELDLYVTEWGAHFKLEDGVDSHNYTGLRSIPLNLEMFTQYLTHGADSLIYWPMQFHATSTNANNGDVNFIGDFFTLLENKTLGMQAMDTGVTNTSLDVHAFTDGDTAVIFVSSLQSATQEVDLDFAALFPDVDSYTVTTIGVDPDSVDGYYKNDTQDDYNWAAESEPDAAMQLTEEGSYAGAAPVSFNLDGYEVVMIEFELGQAGETINGTAQNDTLYGTDGIDEIFGNDGDDRIYDGAGSDIVYGGAGKDRFYAGDGADSYDGGVGLLDEVRYTTAAEGLTIDLSDPFSGTGIARGDSFVNVERLRGSEFDDVVIGGSGVAIINAEAGDDVIVDGAVKNYLTGGDGADTFQMIAGDGHEDRIFDFTLSEDTLDLSLWGVGDLSQLTFTEGANGTYLLISFEEESVRLNGYSAADIASFDETVFVFDPNAPTGDGVVVGTSGNDVIDSSYVDQDGDTINDLGQLIQAGDGSDTVFDGAGDDIVEGGAGRDYFFAGDGADAYDGGSDNKDELWYTTSLSGLTIDLGDASNSTGIAAGDTVTNVERVRGTDYDDVIIAGSGVTNIKGLSGNDLLIDSDAATKEYFTGGAGADTFRFVSGDGQEDRIYDFSVAEDMIDLSLWGVTSLDDLTISAGGSETYLIIEYGDERIRVDDYGSADIAAFDENVFIFA